MSGSKAEDFHEGETVLYVPRHAQGDITHPDCEHGVVSSQNGESVFVRYYRNGMLQPGSQATYPTDLRGTDP
jgi:hypothetical protein